MVGTKTYKGYTVNVGVSWTYDKKSLTVKMYPSAAGDEKLVGGFKPVKKTWKNYCPACKQSGYLRPIGSKGRKYAVEGEINCAYTNKNGGRCDSDYSGVSGKEKEGRNRKLTPASAGTTTKTEDLTKEIENKNKKAIKTAKQEYKDNKTKTSDVVLKIPDFFDIEPFFPVKVCTPIVSKNKLYYCDEYNTDTHLATLSVSETFNPETKYSPPTSDKYISSNPSVVSYDGGEDVVKWVKAKGKELGSVSKIAKYFKTSGTYGMNYAKYDDWGKHGGKWTELNKKAFAAYLKEKKGNCVMFAYLMYYACMGAKLKVEIVFGKASLKYYKGGHAWNRYKNKNIDLSTSALYRSAGQLSAGSSKKWWK